jgi:hypothetical protein|nr:MAG TPA: hypothetical protein [Caudoviricetes sp.]
MTKLTDIGQILALCAKMTNLKLEVVCGFDRQFAAKWYENEYLTGRHVRYVMKPDKFIASVEDGKVYRAFNTSDAKAVELMESNPEYRDFFIDMEAVPNTIPELGDDPFTPEPEGPEAENIPELGDDPFTPEPEVTEPEVTEPEVTEPTEPEVTEPTEPEAEPTEEEIAAAKRSAAAKKAAATRAAKKAAEEAENADISEFE